MQERERLVQTLTTGGSAILMKETKPNPDRNICPLSFQHDYLKQSQKNAWSDSELKF